MGTGWPPTSVKQGVLTWARLPETPVPGVPRPSRRVCPGGCLCRPRCLPRPSEEQVEEAPAPPGRGLDLCPVVVRLVCLSAEVLMG